MQGLESSQRWLPVEWISETLVLFTFLLAFPPLVLPLQGSQWVVFRAAGAETVVAALWPVVDDAARIFAEYFYEALGKRETKPSQAVVEAKQRLRQEADYKHWIFWGPFVCIGYNFPLFMPNIFA